MFNLLKQRLRERQLSKHREVTRKKLGIMVDAVFGRQAAGETHAAEKGCAELAAFLNELELNQVSSADKELLGKGLVDLASGYREMSKRAEAEASYAKAIAVWQELGSTKEYSKKAKSQIAACKNQLGLVCDQSGTFALAVQHLNDAVRMRKELMAEFPEDLENRVYLGGALCNRAYLACEMDDKMSAADLFRESIAVIDTALPECTCGCRQLTIAHMEDRLPPWARHWLQLAEQFKQNAMAGLSSIGLKSSGDEKP